MADFSGRQEYIGLGREITRGTAVAATYWLEWLTNDFEENITKIKNDGAAGTLARDTKSAKVEQFATGKVGGKVTDKTMGMVLAGMFGSTPTSALKGGETLVYNHTYAMTESVLGTSFTIYRKNPNLDVRHTLGMFDKSELSVSAGEWVKFETELMAKAESTTTSTPVLTSQTEFVPRNVTVKLANNVAGLSGASAIPVKDAKINIERKVESYFATGSDQPDEIYSQEVKVTGEITLRWTNNTYRDLWKDDTEQALSLTIQASDVTIGNSSNPTLVITVPRLVLEEWSSKKDKGAIVEQTISLSALYDYATSSQISAVLTNTVASY